MRAYASVPTAATVGSPAAAHWLSTPAAAPTIWSAGPPIERTRAISGSARPVTSPPTTNAAPIERRSPEGAEPELPADPPGARDHRVEGDDRRALLARDDAVQIGLADGAGHAGRRGDEEERSERRPERGDEPDHDGGARLDRRCAKQQRRPPSAPTREDVDHLVAGDRRERDCRGDEPCDPDCVAVQQLEEIRLRGVERPHEEAELDGRRQHQQAERSLAPAECDALAGVPDDGGRKLREGDPPRLVPDVVHDDVGDAEDDDEQTGADEVRDREIELPEEAAADRPREHRDAGDLLAAREDDVERPRVASDGQCVDEPRLHRPRVEGEAQAHCDRHDRERDDARADLREPDVAEGRRCQHRHGEQERHASAECVRDDTGRDLEHDHAGREGRVGDEHLEEREARLEQEQGVDPPDQGRRERVEPGEGEVAGEHAPRDGG